MLYLFSISAGSAEIYMEIKDEKGKKIDFLTFSQNREKVFKAK